MTIFPTVLVVRNLRLMICMKDTPMGVPVGNIPVWEEMRGGTDGAEST